MLQFSQHPNFFAIASLEEEEKNISQRWNTKIAFLIKKSGFQNLNQEWMMTDK